MPYYRLLSVPFREKAPLGYKGIYRCEPDYREEDGDEIHDFWYRYVSYTENGKVIGVTDELSIDELLRFSRLLNQTRNEQYEVIGIDQEYENLAGSFYYGIDVSSIGGYSMIGDGFFNEKLATHNSEKTKLINRYFQSRLNQFGLFFDEKTAKKFLGVLNDLKLRGFVEPEESFLFHIVRLDNT